MSFRSRNAQRIQDKGSGKEDGYADAGRADRARIIELRQQNSDWEGIEIRADGKDKG